MAKLTRKTAKVFGSTATSTGDDPAIGQFGSGKLGTYVGTGDIDTIQALSAWLNGWADAVTPTQQYPALPEMTGVHKVLSYQSAYILQEGVPEYDANTEYHTGSICKKTGTFEIYGSVIDNNTGNQLSDSTKWQFLIDFDKVLTQRQITNCILQDPQNIKLELNNGTLTLKAGSVVCVPNGFETDGVTPKFDEITVQNDLNYTSSSGTIRYIHFRNESGTLSLFAPQSNTSGTTPPTGTGGFYNTTTNTIKYYSSGSPSSYNMSFPIAKISISSGAISSIDEIYQSVGYIGSTVFVRKGLRGLMPNGRNADGSLKNIEFETNKVLTQDQPLNRYFWLYYSNGIGIGYGATVYFGGNPEPSSSGIIRWFDYSTHKMYISGSSYGGGGKWIEDTPILILGTQKGENNVITDFQPKTAFRAIDYNEYLRTPHLETTYVNGTSGYNIWSNGYCEQWGVASLSSGTMKTLTFLKTFKDTNANIQAVTRSQTQDNASMHCQQISASQFIIGGGASSSAYWEAKGYLASSEY